MDLFVSLLSVHLPQRVLTSYQDQNRSGDISFSEVSSVHSWKLVITLSLNRVLYQFTGLWRYIEVSVL